MSPEESQCVQECLQKIAAILYRNTPATELTTFESLEKAVRTHYLEQVGPKKGLFFIQQATGTNKGRERVITSCVGKVSVTEKQAQKLGLKRHTRLSPVMEKNSLRLWANESYQNAEEDIEALTGVKVSHSTLQRLVHRQDFALQSCKASRL